MASTMIVYRMLSYVFDLLNEEGYTQIAKLNLEGEGDLLGNILTKGIKKQVSKGLERTYEQQTDLLPTLRGSININETIRGFYQEQMKLVCDFDEYTENSYMNRILKTTMERLLISEHISENVQHEIYNLMGYFVNVDTVAIKDIRWSTIHYHRNNQTYRMLMNICHLILRGLRQDNNSDVMNFMDNEYMRRLYTKFWLTFLQKHYPDLNVSAMSAEEYIEPEESIYDILMLRGAPEMFELEYKGRTHVLILPYYDRQVLRKTGLSTNDLLLRDTRYLRKILADKRKLSTTLNYECGIFYGWSDNVEPEDISVRIEGIRVFTKKIDMKAHWLAFVRAMKDAVAEMYGSVLKFYE